ncbi:MAG: class I SAM-dependent methyltransferase [Chitinophagales bacterium]|nr:class I SAM-dependent methyltransferase [Chitinophagales bacterium]MDW8273526.1 class I SAM-dependent methyltransferase [Chitinophagales bacterium]
MAKDLLNKSLLTLAPSHFKEYSLIDSGNGSKLERFGKIVTIRPEPQAVWAPSLPVEEWQNRADVQFIPTSSNSGKWKKIKPVDDKWTISYSGSVSFRFILSLTGFKHVGIFPEQAVNWEYIASNIKKLRQKFKEPDFLNLFAYTGGASLAARAAGAKVTHVDSIKQVITWANENMRLSGLSDIRWVVEDALKFVRREARRGNKYHGIILDPPAYGHGPEGEKWKLEEKILEMMNTVQQILHEGNCFLILNAYSLGFSALILENLIDEKFRKKNFESGELYVMDEFGKKLPLGAFVRFSNLSS